MCLVNAAVVPITLLLARGITALIMVCQIRMPAMAADGAARCAVSHRRCDHTHGSDHAGIAHCRTKLVTVPPSPMRVPLADGASMPRHLCSLAEDMAVERRGFLKVTGIGAGSMLVSGMGRAIASGHVTYDFARLMPGATEISCSAFGENIIENM